MARGKLNGGGDGDGGGRRRRRDGIKEEYNAFIAQLSPNFGLLRERRSRIILADGELEASKKLAKAAKQMAAHGGVTLRLLQTIQEISTENTSTVIIPFPADLTGAVQKVLSSGNSPSITVSTDSSETEDLEKVLEKDAEDILEDVEGKPAK